MTSVVLYRLAADDSRPPESWVGSNYAHHQGSRARHVEGQEHEVFHVYTNARVTVRPWVDVTYRGRDRVEGGRWFTIPERLTVPGSIMPLEVVSARVHLVG